MWVPGVGSGLDLGFGLLGLVASASECQCMPMLSLFLLSQATSSADAGNQGVAAGLGPRVCLGLGFKIYGLGFGKSVPVFGSCGLKVATVVLRRIS